MCCGSVELQLSPPTLKAIGVDRRLNNAEQYVLSFNDPTRASSNSSIFQTTLMRNLSHADATLHFTLRFRLLTASVGNTREPFLQVISAPSRTRDRDPYFDLFYQNSSIYATINGANPLSSSDEIESHTVDLFAPQFNPQGKNGLHTEITLLTDPVSPGIVIAAPPPFTPQLAPSDRFSARHVLYAVHHVRQ